MSGENIQLISGQLKNSLTNELKSILSFWSTIAVDNEHGGFYGKIANDNTVVTGADKGAVLNARILWTFSAAYNLLHQPEYLATARRSLDYVLSHFIDRELGGVFWSLDSKGKPSDTKKQIYAIAFTIYGLSEYYRAVPEEGVLTIAKDLFYSIEKHSYDSLKGGYLEAFARDWNLIDDLRLSDKDANEKKTMNTHLHILEAYTNLYRIWPDELLRGRIMHLVELFRVHIINSSTCHLNLFFDENWQLKSQTVSYGHDIEASWLLLEAAEVLDDEVLIGHIKELALKIADAAAKGLDNNGAMNYEFEPAAGHLIPEKHWWVQAEAMVGFFNAWQLSGEAKYLEKTLTVWNFIQKYIIDKQNGEWFWGVGGNREVMEGKDKAGFWKCPYHNGRACIELISRIEGRK